MVISTSEAIFLGNFADADTDELTPVVEDTSVYLGVFGSVSNPLHQDQVIVTYDDFNNDGKIDTDNLSSTETISYDTGTGPTTTLIDSVAVVAVTVTYEDGSSQSYTNVVMFQDATVNLFLTNSDFAGTDLNSGSGSTIQSIDVTSVTDTNFVGLYQNALQDFVCFAAGTLLRTPNGDQRVETIKAGDLVNTLDHGPQPVRWIGVSRVEVTDRLAPVRIRAGALGPGLPETDLLVSQQHRMLIRSKIAHRMFDAPEVLVTAKKLLRLDGVDLVKDGGYVTYCHVMFDDHQIVFANDAPSESLLPGPQALDMMGDDARLEILTIFPDLATSSDLFPAARAIPVGRQQRKLVERHLMNHQQLIRNELAVLS